MDNRQDGGNVIHIIGGDESDIQADRRVSATMYEYNETFSEGLRTADLSYEEFRLVDNDKANAAKLEDTFQIPSLGSSSVSVETDRLKNRYCKMFNAGGCPFGDSCTYNHDEQFVNRETTAIVLGRESTVGYRNGGATGNLGPVPQAPLPTRPPVLPSAPQSSHLPIAQATFSTKLKPPNWRTRICIDWKQAGYCAFGSKCNFAHGEEELQRYRPVTREANLNNQGLMLPNNGAASASSVARVVGPSVSSAALAGGSEQPPDAAKRSFQKWPKKINRIYGDWIDDC